MSENHVRIPSISADILDQIERCSLTRQYLDDNDEARSAGAELLDLLESVSAEDGAVEEIEALVDEFEIPDVKAFFEDQNLAEYVLAAHNDQGISLDAMVKHLQEQFPIFAVIDSDVRVMEDQIDRHTEIAYNEFYPLYCRPTQKVIRHFIEVCPSVAFMEVGDGNYFAYLTSSGQDFSVQIAYAYLKVDQSVPYNLLAENTDLSLASDTIRKALSEFKVYAFQRNIF